MVTEINFGNRNIWESRSGAPVKTTHVDYDRRDIDISDEIGRYWPEETPFISILMQASKVSVGSKEFIWWDKDRPEWWTELTDDYVSGDDEIDVDDAHFLNEKDLIKNVETGEVMYIDDIDYGGGTGDSDRLTVVREVTDDSASGWGTSAASSDGSDDEILKLGNAMEENSLSPNTWATQPKKRHNYVQTIRTPFDGSNDVIGEGVKAGPDERTRLRREKLFEHRTDIERQILFGERKQWIDSDNKIRRITGGIIQFLEETNGVEVYDLGSENNGILTESEWRNFCSGALKYGSNTKLFLTSRFVAQRLDEHAAGRIETTSEEETYGLKLNRYITTHGDVIIATTEMFERAYGSMGLMLDIENIKFRPFDGEDSTLKINIQENDRDGWKDEYMTKAGLQLELAKTHSILEGVS